MRLMALILAALFLSFAGTAHAQTLNTSSEEAFFASMKAIGETITDQEGQALMFSLVAYAAGTKPGEANWIEEMTKVANDHALLLAGIQPLNGMTVDEIKTATETAKP